MRDVPLTQRTTTNPEKACALRDATCLGFAFGRILHQVPDGPAGAFNPGEAEGPPAGLVGLWQNKSSWDPEQDVVMRPPSFREFEDPLPADCNPAPVAEATNPLDEAGDIGGVPVVVVAVRERDQKRLEPRPAARKAATSRVCRADNDSSHPPDSPCLVDVA